MKLTNSDECEVFRNTREYGSQWPADAQLLIFFSKKTLVLLIVPVSTAGFFYTAHISVGSSVLLKER